MLDLARFPPSNVRDGFTLIEIMVVVAIIGILAVIAIPNYVQYGINSRRAACIANLRTLEGAMEQCRLNGNDSALTMDVL